MKLQSIKISNVYKSSVNLRGEDEGQSFNDLVASIREKGVLMPVLVRPKPKGGKQFEVVAGNRRLRAAKLAGLEEIPAKIERMTDDEAREAQIVENLQREDIHPIEEGWAYRNLVEESRYEIKSVAAKVGKSESYVRQRLFLTNLTESIANAYRAGKFNDGVAVLVARLSPGDQAETWKYIKDSWEEVTVREMKDWIEKEFYDLLSNQPWLSDKKAAEAIGPCKECPKVSTDLFGNIKEGQCTDLKCWKRKMGLYISYRRKQADGLVNVSDQYGRTEKGVLSPSDYKSLSSKKKDHCDFAQRAIVVEGSGSGKLLWICVDSKCKKHGLFITSYRQTPAEKKRRKEELKKAQAKKAREEKELAAVLDRIKWPMSEKVLDAILESRLGRGVSILRPVVKRHGLEVKMVSRKNWDGKMVKERDVEATLRDAVKEMKPREKLRLVVEIILEDSWEDMQKRIIKKL